MEIAIDYSSLPKPNLNHTGIKIMNSKIKKQNLDIWDSNRNSWCHHWYRGLYNNNINFFERDHNKENGIYILYKAKNCIENNDMKEIHANFNALCGGAVGKWSPVSPIWHDGYVHPLHTNNNFIEKYNVGFDNPNHNLCFQNWKIVYNGAPYFYIAYCNLVDLNSPIAHDESTDDYIKFTNIYTTSNEMEEWYVNQHPYNSSFTMAGLFKLIIDWDISYNLFNNRESMATLCHSVMMAINMPDAIYEEIYNSTPTTPIHNYIKNIDTNSLSKNYSGSDTLISWFKDKYWELQDRYDREETIGELNENYYRKLNYIYR